ncbi:MAG: trypsin-like peptidase domain-containing protein, partial [Desulfobacterales bacterium]
MLQGQKCWKGIFSVAFLTILWGISPATSAESPVQPNAKRFSVSELSAVDVLEISGIDLDKAAEGLAAGPDKGPYPIGVAAEVNVQPGMPFSHEPTKASGQIRGTWEKVEDGIYLWRLRVLSPGAKWLSFGFTRFNLPPEASLYVYSMDYQWVAGPYTAKDNEVHGQLWTPMILGEEVVLELTAKAEEMDRITLVLGSVTHGYRGPVGIEKLEKSGSCNVDVACPEGELWRNEIRSVGLYTFRISGGTAVCTGTLINNTSQDGSPYFLTANHCLSESSMAASVVVYWEYESDSCRTPGSSASGNALPRPGASQSGAILRAHYAESDFCLLELDDPIDQQAHDVYWSGWDRTGANPISAVCIHQPSGHEKRIALENDPLTTTAYLATASPGNGTHYRVADWDSGTTEGGSSGSGLWDQNRRIVGQLHGGYAACGNNDSDWYGRLSISWNGGGAAANRLRNWLDPAGTGAAFMNGYEGTGQGPTPTSTRYSYAIQPMAFEDISTTGTDLRLEDDDYAHVSIPFGFPFFDQNFT